jgi:hypothetical protein
MCQHPCPVVFACADRDSDICANSCANNSRRSISDQAAGPLGLSSQAIVNYRAICSLGGNVINDSNASAFPIRSMTCNSHPSDADVSFAELLLNWMFFYHRAGGGMDHPDRAYSELSSCTASLRIPPTSIVNFGRRRGYVFQTWQEDAKAANCLKHKCESRSAETASRVLSQHASSRFRRCSQSPMTKGDSRFRPL